MRDFSLETYFSKWEFTAKYHMTASDMESMALSDLLALASPEDQHRFESLGLGYTETFGLPELRTEISRTYDSADPEHILCFAGAEEGVYVAMQVLLTAEDHAIVIVPNYQAAETLPLSICEVSGVPLNPMDNWALDVDQIKQALRPNTKLISINFPNNPTGAILSRDRYDGLIDLCRERGIYLFSDEVYRLLERKDDLRLPQAADVYERALSLNVMSKAYGLPGLRIGWIMSRDTEVLQRMERYKHYLSICNSAPSEHLALIALKAKEIILARNRTLIGDNLKKLTAFFNDFPNSFDWKEPDGGCVGYPRYTGPMDTNIFCESLVRETGVLLLPPVVYRSELIETPKDRFRIGYGRKNIEKGVSVFRDYLLKTGHN
jgi:aspartate/methionine/tyrosine aminotransferase